MSRFDCPDHPVIRNLERTGSPGGREPDYPACPRCGGEASTMYKTALGEIVGCEHCLRPVDAWEVWS